MLIKQISVFVENKAGRLAEITQVQAALKEAGLTVSQTDVIAIGIDDTPGSFAGVLQTLAAHGMDVDYVYAFLGHSVRACVIVRLEENERALEVLREAGVRIYSAEEVYQM